MVINLCFKHVKIIYIYDLQIPINHTEPKIINALKKYVAFVNFINFSISVKNLENPKETINRPFQVF